MESEKKVVTLAILDQDLSRGCCDPEKNGVEIRPRRHPDVCATVTKR